MSLEFRGLGTVEVWRNGTRLPLGGAKQRGLLALLMLEPNHVLPADRLMDKLWPDARRDRSTLYRLASRLRGVLPAGDDVVVSRSGGYVLAVDPDQVDLHRFEHLVHRGRRELVSGNIESGAQILEDALALWQGSALTGVPDAVRDGPATRLEELRMLAIEERVAAQRKLGHHGQLIPQLQELLEEHPWRQRLAAELMTALHQSGRGAEALEVYRRTRQRMIEELGLEPGKALQHVQHHILAGEPAVEYSERADRQTWLPVPAQLPPMVPDFTGRSGQLDRLHALLGDDSRPAMTVVAVCGGAGVGKTALAVAAAHRLREHYPDGQLYVNLHGTSGRRAPAAEALDGFLRALGTAPPAIPATEEERTALYRSCLADRRVLVVLDDALDPAQVRPLLPGSPLSGVLITSRSRLASLEGVQLIDLNVLAPDEALALLDRIAGPGRAGAEPAAARRLIQMCAGLPLAVRIAGARIAARPGRSIRALADRLADEHKRLDELNAGDLTVRAAFELSYRTLAADQARALRLLGTLECDTVPAGAADALLGGSDVDCERTLEQLVDGNLVSSPEPDRYEMHDLMRLFARECSFGADSDAERSEGLTRVLRWYLATLRHAHRRLQPGWPVSEGDAGSYTGQVFTSDTEAVAWLGAERANLIALIDQACQDTRQPTVLAGRIVECMKAYLALGFLRDCSQAARAILAAATRDGDERAEACARLVLGSLAGLRHLDFNQLAEQLTRAVLLSQNTGEVQLQARAYNLLGGIYLAQRHYDKAQAAFHWLLETGRRSAVPGYQSAALCNLGVLHNAQGDPEHAVACLEPALEQAETAADYLLQAAILDELGRAHQGLHRHQAAANSHTRSIELFHRHGDRHGEASALLSMADAQLSNANTAAALTYARDALELSHRIGLRYITAQSLVTLGHIHAKLGDHPTARACWQEALTSFEAMKAPNADDVRTLLNTTPPKTPEGHTQTPNQSA